MDDLSLLDKAGIRYGRKNIPDKNIDFVYIDKLGLSAEQKKILRKLKFENNEIIYFSYVDATSIETRGKK
jgi:hypothetical protein